MLLRLKWKFLVLFFGIPLILFGCYLGSDYVDYSDIYYRVSAGLTGVEYGSSSFADVDGDGDQDLVITGDDGNTETAKLYINGGTGLFTDAAAGLTGVGGIAGSQGKCHCYCHQW